MTANIAKMSKPLYVYVSMIGMDNAGGTADVTQTISDRTITFNTQGATGSANVLIKGRA